MSTLASIALMVAADHSAISNSLASGSQFSYTQQYEQWLGILTVLSRF